MVKQLLIILMRPGFVSALKQVLRLKKGGMWWAGVPCSLLVFISMGTSGRHLRPMGFEDQPKVANSNLLLSRTALLALVVCRAVFWAVEQPGSSVLPRTPYFEHLMQLGEVLKSPTFFVRLPGPKISAVFQGNSCACGCACLLSCMGAYNHMSVKPAVCFGSWPDPQACVRMVRQTSVCV